MSSILFPSNLLKHLEQLRSGEEEKKKYGEVFTPPKLINTILDHFPTDIWKNKNLKWLDPAAGIGNFGVMVYFRLMGNLDIQDENERRIWILEEMLYAVEINPKNVKRYIAVLNPLNDVTLNIHTGDFLQDDIFSGKKFDIVLGNPPFQQENKKGTKTTGNTIWQFFVKKGLRLLKQRGYFSLIHPCGWRKPCYSKSQLQGLFTLLCHDHHMLRLVIYNSKKGKEIFGCGTRFDWYIVEKASVDSSRTLVTDEEGKEHLIDMQTWEWLPNSCFGEVRSLLSSDSKNTCNVILDSAYHTLRDYVSDNETLIYKYPLINSTPKRGVKYKYSKYNNKGHFGLSKVIFGETGVDHIVIDLEGKYGMTQGAMAILVSSGEEADLLQSYILSPKFRNILKACTWGNYRIDWRLFTHFRKDFYIM